MGADREKNRLCRPKIIVGLVGFKARLGLPNLFSVMLILGGELLVTLTEIHQLGQDYILYV